MTLGAAVILFCLFAAGAVLAALFLRARKTLRVVCMVLCILAAAALAVYIGLTFLFLDAIGHQPPRTVNAAARAHPPHRPGRLIVPIPASFGKSRIAPRLFSFFLDAPIDKMQKNRYNDTM